MKLKWLTVVLIIVGAVLLIIATGISAEVTKATKTGFQIAGIIFLMAGIYRASQRSGGPKEKEDEDGEKDDKKR